MLISIIIHVSCDACGQCFQVAADEAAPATSAYGLAETAICGALDYRDTEDRSGWSSIESATAS